MALMRKGWPIPATYLPCRHPGQATHGDGVCMQVVPFPFPFEGAAFNKIEHFLK